MRTPTSRRIRGDGRSWLFVPAVLSLVASAAMFAAQVRADNSKKIDPWCKVVEDQLRRNDEAARKGHSSEESERLREERRRIEKDYRDRNCDGH